jgi:hypothetical protein
MKRVKSDNNDGAALLVITFAVIFAIILGNMFT